MIEESVNRHMVADVPVSSFLSGGLDSSLIAVLAKKKNNQLSTYTISTSKKDKKIEQMPDDEKYANIVASQRPASTPSKVARRQLAEIFAAIQAIEVGERALKDGLLSERPDEAVGGKTLERLYRGGREWA